jgi:hypothetical protein
MRVELEPNCHHFGFMGRARILKPLIWLHVGRMGSENPTEVLGGDEGPWNPLPWL